MKKILITGAAGFIGFHLSKLLLNKGYHIIGIDSYEKSYGKKIKKERVALLNKFKNYYFKRLDINKIDKIKTKIDLIIHLAAEAGVRKSLKDPYHYVNQNINKTIKVFEFAKKNKIQKIIYASSSSVYGNNKKYPSSEHDIINKPLSIYGITKITTENIAYYYNQIFKINSIGLRFFTVYGPMGRPDMSIFIFFKSILKNKLIKLNNYGENLRDYTFVEDITKYILKIIQKIKTKNTFFDVFNIGGQKNIKLKKVIKKIERLANKKAKIKLMPKNQLDPENSLATMSKLNKFVSKEKMTTIDSGLEKTYNWINNYIK